MNSSKKEDKKKHTSSFRNSLTKKLYPLNMNMMDHTLKKQARLNHHPSKEPIKVPKIPSNPFRTINKKFQNTKETNFLRLNLIAKWNRTLYQTLMISLMMRLIMVLKMMEFREQPTVSSVNHTSTIESIKDTHT